MNMENLCQICREKSAPYKCPKCRIRYCSLTCYRDNLHKNCSKEFDENEFFDSMNIDETNSENQTRTTTNNFVRERIDDIMKRKLDEKDLYNENDDEQMDELFEHLLPTKDSETYREEPIDLGEYDEDDGNGEGEERIHSDNDEESLPDLPNDIDESDENINQLWNNLTTEEKREFKSMLTDGRISHILNDYKPWKPWWLYKTEAPALITDVEAPTPSPNLPDTIPTIQSNIIPLPSLTSILPHVHVRFDLFEILFAYVLINIRYRGDTSSYIPEAAIEFIHISSRHLTQKSERIINDEQDSISVLHTRISLIREYLQDKNLTLRLSEEFFVNLLADILMIIHGPYPQKMPSNLYVLAALSDLKRFIIKIQEYKPSEESTTTTNEDKSSVINVFHMNRTVTPKVKVNRSNNSKLCIQPSHTKPKETKPIKEKKSTPFNRKLLQSLLHKIDYLLSWTMTHSNRLIMLEFELEQIEQDLRRQLNQYQHDKDRIEKNLKHIRLQQKNLIQEL